jgi:hypothetical protein
MYGCRGHVETLIHKSSEMQFLGLVDVQLNKYTTTLDELDSLPDLKYTGAILYRHS